MRRIRDILHTIGNTVAHVVTLPFRLLAKLIPGGRGKRKP